MGAEAVHDYVSKRIDLDQIAVEMRNEMQASSDVRRKKATKRLRVVEALRKSGNRPHWMIFTALPVIPPELRPMVQLDGGRFATSDLNDLYRRVINRNNRLKRLLELGRPDIIVRNEKRMLQEAVDALIDNGRRGRVVSGSGKHKLKSLSDMLKGKQGRFRQNLLGKRVDYSGRSVIVVGPTWALTNAACRSGWRSSCSSRSSCGGWSTTAMPTTSRRRSGWSSGSIPKVWDVLEEVSKTTWSCSTGRQRCTGLASRRSGPIDRGSAIQIHPLVCSAFNADFDGDQMAVHVPLSRKAQTRPGAECSRFATCCRRRTATRSFRHPGHRARLLLHDQRAQLRDREPRHRAARVGQVFLLVEEVKLAYEAGAVDLQARQVRTDGRRRVEADRTTVGAPSSTGAAEELTSTYNTRWAGSSCGVWPTATGCSGSLQTARVVNEIKKVGSSSRPAAA
jgi:DNA-directed RNA polymerase subunit beta'